MKSREVISQLLDAGFQIVGQNGSHLKLKRNGIMTIVPVHKGKDIPKETLRQIQKQTGVKLL